MSLVCKNLGVLEQINLYLLAENDKLINILKNNSSYHVLSDTAC